MVRHQQAPERPPRTCHRWIHEARAGIVIIMMDGDYGNSDGDHGNYDDDNVGDYFTFQQIDSNKIPRNL